MARNPLTELLKGLPSTVIEQARDAAVAAAKIVIEESKNNEKATDTARSVAFRFRAEAREATKRAAERGRDYLERKIKEYEQSAPPERPVYSETITAEPMTAYEQEEMIVAQMRQQEIPENITEVYENMELDEFYEIEMETEIEELSPKGKGK